MAGEEATQLELPEVVVKIEPETQAAPEVVVKAEIKDPAVKDLVEQYKELEANSEKQRIAKEEAQARATAAQNEAAAARREAEVAKAAAVSSNLDTITTALSSAQAEAEAAKRDIKIAIQNGDADAQADAYERMAKATTLVSRYDEAKSDLETRKAAPQKREAPADPVEAYAAGRTEQTANWLREHREFVIDPRKNQKLTAAHHDAVAEGYSPDTPEYFSHVEKFVGIKKDEEKVVTAGDDVARPGAVKKPAQRAVAPVNGSGGSGGAIGGTEVRLSAREAEAANDGTHVWNYDDPSGQKKFKKGDPIGTQEFARRKMKLTQQGAYDRSYETQ